MNLLREVDIYFDRDFDELQRKWDEQHAAKRVGERSLASSTATPAPCLAEGDVQFVNGEPSFETTFAKCLLNVSNPMSLPTLINGTVGKVLDVATNIQLNNLHVLDAVSGSVTIDFYLRLYWRDDRIAMPEFWSLVSPAVRKDGFYLTWMLQEDKIPVWLPDIRFHDAAQIDVLAQTLKVNSSNVFFWSRHVVLTLMQPGLSFHSYPSDEQTLIIRYGSYSFAQSTLNLFFLSPAVSYNQNFDSLYTFLENPLWQHERSWSSWITYVSSSGFKNAVYTLPVRRVGSGVMLRLVVPITILTVLGGVTFWSEASSRFDSTITLLLSVSALYIVILGNIPLLGYLTSIDTYCFLMFLLLALVALMHQSYHTLNGVGRVDDWDRRKILRAAEEQRKAQLGEEPDMQEDEEQTYTDAQNEMQAVMDEDEERFFQNEEGKETSHEAERRAVSHTPRSPRHALFVSIPRKRRSIATVDTAHTPLTGTMSNTQRAKSKCAAEDEWNPTDLRDFYPLRQVTVQLIESFGKVFVFPAAIWLLLIVIQGAFTQRLRFIVWLITTVCAGVLCVKESYRVWDALKKSFKSLRKKEKCAASLLSFHEIRFLNGMRALTSRGESVHSSSPSATLSRSVSRREPTRVRLSSQRTPISHSRSLSRKGSALSHSSAGSTPSNMSLRPLPPLPDESNNQLELFDVTY